MKKVNFIMKNSITEKDNNKRSKIQVNNNNNNNKNNININNNNNIETNNMIEKLFIYKKIINNILKTKETIYGFGIKKINILKYNIFIVI